MVLQHEMVIFVVTLLEKIKEETRLKIKLGQHQE